MEEYKITAYRLSKETGITQATLSRWKTGKTEPSIETLQIIADYFNVSVDYLLGQEKKEEKKSIDSSELDGSFFRLKKGLEPFGLNDDDADFLLAVYKAHKEKKQ